MGGKNPTIVLADADFNSAVENTVNAAFFSTGQKCTATSRAIVEDKIYDRFLESLVLQPEQVKGVQSHGPIVGVLGILVGFGSNYLSAIAAEGRIVLNNGTHRAYALRELGLKQAPCVIQKAATRREVKSVAVGSLRKHPDLYLKEPRPPVLKDYFDDRLRQGIRIPPVQRHVKVRFTVDGARRVFHRWVGCSVRRQVFPRQ